MDIYRLRLFLSQGVRGTWGNYRLTDSREAQGLKSTRIWGPFYFSRDSQVIRKIIGKVRGEKDRMQGITKKKVGEDDDSSLQ